MTDEKLDRIHEETQRESRWFPWKVIAGFFIYAALAAILLIGAFYGMLQAFWFLYILLQRG